MSVHFSDSTLALGGAVLASAVTAGVLLGVDPQYEVNTEVSVGSPMDSSLDLESRDIIGLLYASIVQDQAHPELRPGSHRHRRVHGGHPEDLGAGRDQRPDPGGEPGERAAGHGCRGRVDEEPQRLPQPRGPPASSRRGEARQIRDLETEMAERFASDPYADVSGLQSQIDQIRESDGEATQVVQPVVFAQNNNGGEVAWPKIAPTSLVVGLATFLLLQIPLTIWGLMRKRRADALWLRVTSRRFGVESEIAEAVDGGLPPLTESRVVGVLSQCGTVIILGEVDPHQEFGDHDPDRVQLADFDAKWWREIPPDAINLGIVVIDQGDRSAGMATDAVERLVESDIPTILVMRRKRRDHPRPTEEEEFHAATSGDRA
ncbi:hypothetical protein QP028_08610 [Corynebacterium suedekumii]|nr:hypothetical protein QP028_08610 [Corynebacterium suedekumii]